MRHLRLPNAMRRTRIGVEVGRASEGRFVIRAVGVRGNVVVWHRTWIASSDEPLMPGLGTLLTDLPIRRWPRPDITVALGLSFVQLKRLAGLPSLTDGRELTAAVRANAGRFFLRDAAPLATTSVRVDAPGEAWAAAADKPILASIEGACRVAGLRLRAIVPSAVALGATRGLTARSDVDLATSWTIAWADGGWRFALSYCGTRVTEVRRLVRDIDGAMPGNATMPVSDNEQNQLDAAYGAAITPLPLALGWPIEHRDMRALSTWRQSGAAAALVLAVGTVILWPGLSAAAAARQAGRYLRGTAPQQHAARTAMDSLAAVTAALAAGATFIAGRQPVTLALADLARALPVGAAITAYRTDSAGGTLIALAPHASDLVTQLERDHGIAAIAIVGSVTQETVPTVPVVGAAPRSRPMERATIRFRWSDTR